LVWSLSRVDEMEQHAIVDVAPGDLADETAAVEHENAIA
jgi:hypothetical protein